MDKPHVVTNYPLDKTRPSIEESAVPANGAATIIVYTVKGSEPDEATALPAIDKDHRIETDCSTPHAVRICVTYKSHTLVLGNTSIPSLQVPIKYYLP